jgi:hypothetical protein
MLLVGLRPEERQEGVASVESLRGGGSQIAEEGDPFGLRQEGRRLTPGLHLGGDPSKESELDCGESVERRKAAVSHAARLAFKRSGQSRIALGPNVTPGFRGGNGESA